MQIFSLESKIPELNAQICDGSTSVDDPCDELCGGAGCGGMCGGLSCLNGALSKAEEALNSAKMADEVRITTQYFPHYLLSFAVIIAFFIV